MDELGLWRGPGIPQIIQVLHPVSFPARSRPRAADAHRSGRVPRNQSCGWNVPQITSLAEQPRHPGRYRLEVDGKAVATVDGKAVATVDAASVRDLSIHIGVEWTPELAARVEVAAARLATFDKALQALALRARSQRELERWLAQKGHEREHVAAAVERLLALGLLDDAAFARSFARSRAIGRGMSRRRIQAELSRRGVERSVTDAAIAEMAEDEGFDERALVEAAAQKKLRSLSKLAPDVRRRRLYGFLARRGYPPNFVMEVVNRLTKEK